MAEQTFKYFAFISYNSKDAKWARKLQKKLEHYRMPTTMCSENGWESNHPLRPIFFAETDIQPGPLDAELQQRLESSRYLIVICSPNSAQSKWVGKEIEYFIHLGRAENIQFFIVDGVPHSGDPKTECLNPVLDQFELPEILGANIHEKVSRYPWINKERAFVQLISKLLGVEFDSIWNRHRRMMIAKTITWVVGVVVVLSALFLTYLNYKPIDVTCGVAEQQEVKALPPMSNAVVSLYLDNEIKVDTIHSVDAPVVFTNIPHQYLGKETRITVNCHEYQPLDTVVALSTNMVLNVKREEGQYGDVKFTLFDEKTASGMENAILTIAGQTVKSGKDGQVSLFVPLENQNTSYKIESALSLETDTIYMPCGESSIIIVK